MITIADLIALPIDSDLPIAGTGLALRGLAGAGDYQAASRYTALREAAAGVMLSLAARRYLGSQGLAYRLFGGGSGSSRLMLGGHPCIVSSHLVWKPAEFERVTQDLQNLLALELPLPAALPQSLPGADALALFALMSAQVAPDEAAGADRPAWMAHILPPEWARPGRPGLGSLSLHSGADAPLRLALHGLDARGEPLEEEVVLPPGENAAARQVFAGLAAVSTRRPIGAGLTLNAGPRTLAIRPAQWANLYMPPTALWLLGYLTSDDLRRLSVRHSRLEPRISVSGLRPLPRLFERLRRWQAGRGE